MEFLFFSTKILNWYKENRRDLPWRNHHDPYAIWISEIILQQTRVAQGYDYYLRFMQRFPTVVDLAQASQDEVMTQWQGLGYYSRARNLHAAAQQIVSSGSFPSDYHTIRCLKGVGDYTAAAIASFAFGLRHAVVDGNVYRVLSRFFAIDTPIDTGEGKKYFSQLATSLLPQDACVADYNQALMDFGAMQCVPKSPQCNTCVLNEACGAYASGEVERFPVKQHKVAVKRRYFNYYIIKVKDEVVLFKRDGSDIWRGLYEPFLVETMQEPQGIALPETNAWKRVVQGDGFAIKPLATQVKHQLTHRLLFCNFFLLEMEQCDESLFEPYSSDECAVVAKPAIWVKMMDLHNYAFPIIVDKQMKTLCKE